MRRDANEPAIIAALERAGAAVQQLDPPLPDLLVGYPDRCGIPELFLLEVKDSDAGVATRKPHRKNNRCDGVLAALTPSQVVWWVNWRGKPPVIVHTPAEALAAIGATP